MNGRQDFGISDIAFGNRMNEMHGCSSGKDCNGIW